jgi:tetratricopeptide (TPR) repeat protein
MALPLLSAEDFNSCITKAQEALKKGDKDAACSYFEKAIESWHKGDSRQELGKAYADFGLFCMSQQKLEKAIENFSKAIEINPKDGRTYFRMGLVYMAQYKYPEAIKVLEKSIKLTPKFVAGYQTLGDAYRRAHQYDKAILAYKKAMELSGKPNDAMLAGMGESLRANKDYPKARKYLEEAVTKNPDNAIAHYQLGLCYLSLEKNKEAITQLEEALKAKAIIQDSFKVQIVTYLGQAYEKDGNSEKAKECYQKAREILDNIPNESK